MNDIMQQIGNMRKPVTVHRPQDRPWRAAVEHRPQQPQQHPWQERRCYSCNMKGHLVNQYTESGTRLGVCYKCGTAGHMARDCNAGKQIHKIGGGGKFINFIVNFNDRIETWRGLIDTGSPISLLRECCSGEYDLIDNSYDFRGLNSTKLKVLGSMTGVVGLDGKRQEIEFYIVPDNTIAFNVLLWRDF